MTLDTDPVVKSNPDGTTPAGLPTPVEQQNFLDTIRGFLNPQGDNATVNLYINSTFSYILGAMLKMGNSSDRDATAKEIAEDLQAKCEKWLKDWQAAEDAKKEAEKSGSEKTDTEKK